MIGIGTIDAVTVHPREIFRGAIMMSAAAIILMHNHPSGNPSPSNTDTELTRRIMRAGRLLMIDVLDHIIMGKPSPDQPTGYCSLREIGWFYTDIFGDDRKAGAERVRIS